MSMKTHIQNYLDPFTSIEILDGLTLAPNLLIAAGLNVGPFFISYIALMHALRIGQKLFNTVNPSNVTTLHLWASYIILSFGGTTFSSILLARTPGWLSQNTPLVLYTSVFVLFRYTRFFLPLVNGLGVLLRMALAFGDGITRTLVVSKYTIDSIKATTNLPLVACLLCGTLSGCGGGCLYKIFNLAGHPTSTNQLAFNIDSFVALGVAILYTSFVHEWDAVDADLAQGIGCAVAGCVLAINEVFVGAAPRKQVAPVKVVPNTLIKDSDNSPRANRLDATPTPLKSRKSATSKKKSN